jgi:hypothetical protein
MPADVKKPRNIPPIARVNLLYAAVDILDVTRLNIPLERIPRGLLWALIRVGAVPDRERTVEAMGERQHLFRV